MQQKITELNEEQIARIDIVREKWLEIGLSTAPLDKEKIKTLIPAVYEAVDLKPPKEIIWLRSPLEGCIRAEELVREEGTESTSASVKDQIKQCGYGLHDASWLSFYDYFLPYLDNLDIIKPLINLSQEVGWWWPMDEAVIITEKPQFICRDDEFRLHHDSRMALEYSDGFGIYAWHGVFVPKEIILEPEKITIESIQEEENQEIRRIMIERFGWDKYLTDQKAIVIQRDDFGELIQFEKLNKQDPNEDPMAKFVRVTDGSSDRQYILRVPPETETAHEGVAWSFDLTKEEYNPTIQT